MTRIWTVKQILDLLDDVLSLPEDSREWDMKDGFKFKELSGKANKLYAEYTAWSKK